MNMCCGLSPRQRGCCMSYSGEHARIFGLGSVREKVWSRCGMSVSKCGTHSASGLVGCSHCGPGRHTVHCVSLPPPLGCPDCHLQCPDTPPLSCVKRNKYIHLIQHSPFTAYLCWIDHPSISRWHRVKGRPARKQGTAVGPPE